MRMELLDKYDGRVPRYTSYPTAPHFHDGVTEGDYRGWLAALDPGADLSLYLHVPFCKQLCWYCGCNTKVVNRPDPVADYVTFLAREIHMVADAIGRRARVSHIHWGGGTPNALAPDDLMRLFAALRDRYDVSEEAEIAVEIDPRVLTEEWVTAAAACGVTRASLGVQDLDSGVQEAIHRVQPYEQTERAVAWLRAAEIDGINLDLMYGLPRQTVDSVLRTVDRVVALRPDRIALFGYAHVPWMKPHQKLMPEKDLPGTRERYEQQEAASSRLAELGYVQIGLDHFARPEDPMAVAVASGSMRRNFQGYTTDDAPVLVGLGSSSIGRLPQGYIQNRSTVPDWRAAIGAGELPVARGIRLEPDDVLRGAVIERLMCDFAIDLAAVAMAHGCSPTTFDDEAAMLKRFEEDGLIHMDGRRIHVTEAGRPFVRSICATFDRYLRAGEARHARAI
ncbi:oxygen-independent coproporphyrinogen III oxidase [Azospirillum sp. SYSU D00513]|uniref:oxygen-independent coproporphyrinogen III oxidase n=1 Tax=Azospirillum sp. SYSU D00513 TaxID=2812561 RepID=UPI001A977653|nr:oxygen-independent coproporphyrinogen III oxidase [Azospirillum sp. SYSU D00513]